MRSCIFSILFRMHEINCMNMHGRLYHHAEKWGNRRSCGKNGKFSRWLTRTGLWKSLWKVCITFCINRENTVGSRQKRGGESNFWVRYPVFTIRIRQKCRHNCFPANGRRCGPGRRCRRAWPFRPAGPGGGGGDGCSPPGCFRRPEPASEWGPAG